MFGRWSGGLLSAIDAQQMWLKLVRESRLAQLGQDIGGVQSFAALATRLAQFHGMLVLSDRPRGEAIERLSLRESQRFQHVESMVVDVTSTIEAFEARCAEWKTGTWQMYATQMLERERTLGPECVVVDPTRFSGPELRLITSLFHSTEELPIGEEGSFDEVPHVAFDCYASTIEEAEGAATKIAECLRNHPGERIGVCTLSAEPMLRAAMRRAGLSHAEAALSTDMSGWSVLYGRILEWIWIGLEGEQATQVLTSVMHLDPLVGMPSHWQRMRRWVARHAYATSTLQEAWEQSQGRARGVAELPKLFHRRRDRHLAATWVRGAADVLARCGDIVPPGTAFRDQWIQHVHTQIANIQTASDVLGLMTARQFVTHLADRLSAFHPSTVEQVSFYSMEEATYTPLDHLFVTGVSEDSAAQSWSSPANWDSSIAHYFKVPGGDPGEFAARHYDAFALLVRSAPAVTVSTSEMSVLSGNEVPQCLWLKAVQWTKHLRVSGEVVIASDLIQDVSAPLEIGSGAPYRTRITMFSEQVNDPWTAFRNHRLRAGVAELQQVPVDALSHGMWLHQVVHALLQDMIEGDSSWATVDDDAIRQACERAIRDATVPPHLRSVEQSRIFAALTEWVEVENSLEGAPFAAGQPHQSELDIELKIPISNGAGMVARGRIDRVDVVNEEPTAPRYIIWDWKSSESANARTNVKKSLESMADWMGDLEHTQVVPEVMQLLCYACALHQSAGQDVGGVGILFPVRAPRRHAAVLAAPSALKPGDPAPPVSQERVEQTLLAIAAEFADARLSTLAKDKLRDERYLSAFDILWRTLRPVKTV